MILLLLQSIGKNITFLLQIQSIAAWSKLLPMEDSPHVGKNFYTISILFLPENFFTVATAAYSLPFKKM